MERIIISTLLVFIISLCFLRKETVTQDIIVPTIEQKMQVLADGKVADIVNTGYWSHTNSDGCDFACRARKAGIAQKIGENIYRGECGYERAIEAWMLSPSHAQNILDSSGIEATSMVEVNGKCIYVTEYLLK